MNAKTVALFILFLAFGFVAKAGDSYSANAEIPGGIVASNGKDVIYYDFTTKEKTNLTADIKEAEIQDLFAISEDGKILIWLQNNKFLVRKLPAGKVYTLKTDRVSVGWRDRKVEKDFTIHPQDQNLQGINYSGVSPVRSLTISPIGTRFTYEVEISQQAWVQVPPNSPINRNWLQRGPDPGTRLPYVNLPMYVKQMDNCNVVINAEIFSDYLVRRNSSALCGNVAKIPPIYPWRMTYEDGGSFPRPGVTPVPVGLAPPTQQIGPALVLTNPEAIKRFSFKRNAHFAAWSKNFDNTSFLDRFNKNSDKQMFAVIYQTPYGWGPIEIHNPTANPPSGGKGYKLRIKAGMKPGVYEIPVLLRSCEGLAWKPDGSITYLSQGKVFSIDGNKIRQGIENSGIAVNPNPSCYVPIPVNNVFAINSVAIAEDVYSSKIRKMYWVSDYAFIYQGNDNALYLWEQGRVEKLLSSVPKEFFYCRTSPHKNFNVAISSPDLNNTSFPVMFGKDRAPEAVQRQSHGKRAGFDVGTIRTGWTGQNAKCLHIQLNGNLEFAILTENSLDSIKDPSVYEYTKKPYYRGSSKKEKERWRPHHSLPSIMVFINEIIILKSGNVYAAIKPIALEPKYKSVEEMSESMQKDWERYRGKGPPPIYEWLTYEWKFWPNIVPPAKLAKTAQN